MINTENPRYRVEKFHAKSLEGNVIGDSTEKFFSIYLPPGYFSPENAQLRYPVIYLLHGYSGDIDDLLIISKKDIPYHYPLLYRIILRRFFFNFPTFEVLDEHIRAGKLKPFILVQPDGSLSLENIYKEKGFNGKIKKKGSLYLNSPYTGHYMDYIFDDLIEYVDSNYRTIPDKNHRALVGASMGGYGALLGGIFHPHLFGSIAALSPGISWLDLVNREEIVPFYRLIYGKRKATKIGKKDLDDILHTADLVFSKENPLIPSINRDKSGKFEVLHRESESKWKEFDLNYLVEKTPNAFEECNLFITCEETDEYGFKEQIEGFLRTLKSKNITVSADIFQDRFASRVSPHMIGIIHKIVPAFDFCSENFD